MYSHGGMSRLSRPGWLVKYQYGIPANSHHPSTNPARRRATSLMCATPLPLSQNRHLKGMEVVPKYEKRVTDPNHRPLERSSSSIGLFGYSLSTVNLRTKFELVPTASSTLPINSFGFQSPVFKSLYVKCHGKPAFTCVT